MSLLLDHILSNYGLQITDREKTEIRDVVLADIAKEKVNAPIDDGGPIGPDMVAHVINDTGTIVETTMKAKGGLSMRDYFAAAALNGLLHQLAEEEYGARHFAVAAYQMADAMIQARKEAAK